MDPERALYPEAWLSVDQYPATQVFKVQGLPRSEHQGGLIPVLLSSCVT